MTIFREDTIDLKNSVCGRCPKYTSMLRSSTENGNCNNFDMFQNATTISAKKK